MLAGSLGWRNSQPSAVWELDEAKLGELVSQILILQWVHTPRVIHVFDPGLHLLRQRGAAIGRETNQDNGAALSENEAGRRRKEQRRRNSARVLAKLAVLEEVANGDHRFERLFCPVPEGVEIFDQTSKWSHRCP
jgi:hypothetical protein